MKSFRSTGTLTASEPPPVPPAATQALFFVQHADDLRIAGLEVGRERGGFSDSGERSFRRAGPLHFGDDRDLGTSERRHDVSRGRCIGSARLKPLQRGLPLASREVRAHSVEDVVKHVTRYAAPSGGMSCLKIVASHLCGSPSPCGRPPAVVGRTLPGGTAASSDSWRRSSCRTRRQSDPRRGSAIPIVAESTFPRTGSRPVCRSWLVRAPLVRPPAGQHRAGQHRRGRPPVPASHSEPTSLPSARHATRPGFRRPPSRSRR